MSIDKDPEAFKLLITIICGAIGLLNVIGLKMLDRLKNTDGEIFRRLNRSDREISDKLSAIGERLAKIESKIETKLEVK